MGVGVMIGATLLGGYLQGRAARQQANAQAAQAQANADIAYNNAQKLQEQAEKQAQNNEINEENKRRRLLQLAFERYNARQQVDNIFQQSTDNVNQGDIYASSARAYRKAGKRAMMNSMLQAGLSVAANLYTAKSMGALKSSAGKSVGLQNYSVPGYTEMKGLPAHTGDGISSYSNDGWAKAKW